MKTQLRSPKSLFTAFICILMAIAPTGCTNSSKTPATSETDAALWSQYAEFFSVKDDGGRIKELTVRSTWDEKAKDEKYILVPRDCTQILSGNQNALPYPIESVVCMSSSHVAYLSALEEIECIKAVSGTRFIYNDDVLKLIKEEKIVDVGSETSPNYERIIAMKPDLVVTYAIGASDNSHIDILKKLGIKVLTIGDYLENSPLGKMEYVRLFGHLTGKSALADSLFKAKCAEYISIKERLAESMKDSAPTPVLVNMPYKGAWYIPGERSYISQLVRDAGGVILGSKQGEHQSAQYGFEYIYSLALQAKIWLHPNALNTMAELERENQMFKNIVPFKTGDVYNNNLRSTPEGGSDFWETGVVEPHIILQDLAAILHPEIFGAKELKYYHKLK